MKRNSDAGGDVPASSCRVITHLDFSQKQRKDEHHACVSVQRCRPHHPVPQGAFRCLVAVSRVITKFDDMLVLTPACAAPLQTAVNVVAMATKAKVAPKKKVVDDDDESRSAAWCVLPGKTPRRLCLSALAVPPTPRGKLLAGSHGAARSIRDVCVSPRALVAAAGTTQLQVATLSGALRRALPTCWPSDAPLSSGCMRHVSSARVRRWMLRSASLF